jgi:hypothetical protein
MLTRILLLILILPFTSSSQGYIPIGARSASLANATVCLNDVFSFYHNPAGLASIDRVTVGAAYENRFLLRELQSQAMVGAVPLKTGVLSIGAQLYGYELFRMQKAGVGYSVKLAEKLSGGVQLNYLGLRLPDNYGSKHSATAEIGVIGELTENWKVGASVFNLGRARLADFMDDRFSTVMRIGTSYTVSEKALFLLEAEKHIEYKMRAKAGVEYRPSENFFLRFGAATQPIEMSFGFGYRFSSFQIDLGSAFHQRLGWSPHFALIYSGKKK